MSIKRFLKRFERLENTAVAEKRTGPRTLSKRFERLEVGTKSIAIAITDTVAKGETAPQTIRYQFLCAYCGKENPVTADQCAYCKQPLQTEFNLEYQELARKFTRCDCGTINQLPRKWCWLCGKELASGGSQNNNAPENVITITFEGTEYKSNEQFLPDGIRELFERIRKDGYRKEVVEQWARDRAAAKEKLTQRTIDAVRAELTERRTRIYLSMIVATVILIAFAIHFVFLSR